MANLIDEFVFEIISANVGPIRDDRIVFALLKDLDVVVQYDAYLTIVKDCTSRLFEADRIARTNSGWMVNG